MSGEADLSFTIGEKFYSFEEVKDKILRIKNLTGVEFWKSGIRTISCAPKSYVTSLSADLVYYQLRYSCVHSSRKQRVFTADGYRKPA